MLLDALSGPDDLRGRTYDELDDLADQIRRLIIESVNEHGGHLGAVGFIRDDVRMHSADATDTQHTYTHRHKNS